jgi:hypothetical protein
MAQHAHEKVVWGNEWLVMMLVHSAMILQFCMLHS